MVCERWCERQPRAHPGGSAYCACHTTASRGPAATTRAPVMQEALCTAPATPQPAAAQRRPRAHQLRQEALCTVTAPAKRQPAAAQRRPRAEQLRQEALCTAPATRQPAAAHVRSSSARRLCVLRPASRGPAATTSGVMSCAVMSAV